MNERGRETPLSPRVIALARALADVMAAPLQIAERAESPVGSEYRPTDGKLLLRIGDAAERLSISRTKAYELVSAGQLPTVRIGRSVRIPVEALRDWIRRESI
jgi:excisionase family DNA binding protein